MNGGPEHPAQGTRHKEDVTTSTSLWEKRGCSLLISGYISTTCSMRALPSPAQPCLPCPVCSRSPHLRLPLFPEPFPRDHPPSLELWRQCTFQGFRRPRPRPLTKTPLGLGSPCSTSPAPLSSPSGPGEGAAVEVDPGVGQVLPQTCRVWWS